ncbi:MAG: cellulase family glycosylhydrolase [Micropruina sp.]
MDPAAHPPGRALGRRTLLAGVAGAVGASMLASCGTPPLPRFEAVDGVIRDLNGRTFTSIGANIGTLLNFDWKGDARGHASDALEWGWNTVRLNVMVTAGADWSFVATHSLDALLDLVSELVDEYTAAGLVVIIDAHDNPRTTGNNQAAIEAAMASWWTFAATRFRDNPRVWCGLINEPAYANAEWVRINDSLAGAVRATGNANPILIGAPGWGQDVGYSPPYFHDSKFSYEPDMAPILQQRHGNVILEQHNYGAYGIYATADKLAGYLAKVRGAGLTPLIGEFGYTIDRTSTAGTFMANYAAAQAVFDLAGGDGVGALWWHATHGDKYSVKADGSAFWVDGAGQRLSDGGSKLWKLARAH